MTSAIPRQDLARPFTDQERMSGAMALNLILVIHHIPFGSLWSTNISYEKSPCFIGKSTINGNFL